MIEQRYGGLKMVWQTKKMRDLLEQRVSAPVYVRFKPTNRCNHHCSFCSYDPKSGDLDVRDLMKTRSAELPRNKTLEVLDNFGEMGVKAVTYSGGGEPLIYPHIEEAMQKTLDHGIDLSIITNGQKLDRSKADILARAHWVRVSSDASDAESFSKIRGVPKEWFEELTSNLAYFASVKRKGCELGINYVVHKGNADQVYRSIGHFKKLGANHIKITPMWITDFFEYHRDIKEPVEAQILEGRKEFANETFKVFDTYAKDFSSCSVSERGYRRCYVMQTIPVIGADANVYFCHDKAYASSGVLGSIKDRSFKELWFSEEARKKFETFNPKENCRHHCANDAKNILINQAIACYGDDINFP